MCFYELQVLNLTYLEPGSTAFVEDFQAAAWIAATFVAEPHEAFPQPLALLSHNRTVFPARQAARTILDVKSLVPQVVSLRQVLFTDTAVHAAGGDQVLIRCFHDNSIWRTWQLEQVR
jgi:hypothetical protein